MDPTVPPLSRLVADVKQWERILRDPGGVDDY
jgi:hypothetical protein